MRGIGGHQSAQAATVEWLTPPQIVGALGPFDLDPCAPIVQPYRTAARTFTILDDGLAQPWDGRVWLCPPYKTGIVDRWLARLAQHDRGTALIFARTETAAFSRYVWNRASALLFIKGRLWFRVGEGFSSLKTRRTFLAGDEAAGNSGGPLVLCAYGADDADVLATCKIDGAFVPLRIPRSVVVAMFESGKDDKSWRALIRERLEASGAPLTIAELYEALASHPKAAGRKHVREKIRQELGRGPFRRVERGRYEAEA